MIELTGSDKTLAFTVRVIPRASRTEIVGEISGALKIKLRSPPVDGAANRELVKYIASTLGIAKSSVEIVSGHASRTKQIRVHGVTAGQLRDALNLSGPKSA